MPKLIVREKAKLVGEEEHKTTKPPLALPGKRAVASHNKERIVTPERVRHVANSTGSAHGCSRAPTFSSRATIGEAPACKSACTIDLGPVAAAMCNGVVPAPVR
eukprot:scaffold121991_cov30-Tisochrysis_lutea.AAC.6